MLQPLDLPELLLAAQWKIVPKLALNLGGRINIGTLSFATTEGKQYNAGNEVTDSSAKATNNSFTGAGAQLTAGVSFNITDNLGLEASSGIGGTNSVNTFGENGIFYFTNILASLRF